jgi:hypothetical protein
MYRCIDVSLSRVTHVSTSAHAPACSQRPARFIAPLKCPQSNNSSVCCTWLSRITASTPSHVQQGSYGQGVNLVRNLHSPEQPALAANPQARMHGKASLLWEAMIHQLLQRPENLHTLPAGGVTAHPAPTCSIAVHYFTLQHNISHYNRSYDRSLYHASWRGHSPPSTNLQHSS